MVKNYTGCDAVMIGRGALGNPWIFSRVERERVSPGEMFTTIQSHLKLLIEFYGELRGVLLFRKHVIQYLYRFTAFDKIKPELLEATTFLRVMQLVRQIIEFG